MAAISRRAPRPHRRPASVAKPSGAIHSGVQAAGPEHVGIVAVDCVRPAPNRPAAPMPTCSATSAGRGSTRSAVGPCT
jgi:hypothetical protein